MGNTNVTRYQPRPAKTEGQTDLRRRLHVRLDDLLDLADADRLYGEIGVIATCESGAIIHFRRHFSGMDK